MSDLIYHITTIEAWDEARQGERYRPASLDSEGFIHFSRPEQLLKTALRFFGDRDDLIVLRVDPRELQAGLRFEESDGDVFPHFYGALPIGAVTGWAALELGDEGLHIVPQAWSTGVHREFVISTPIGGMSGRCDGDVLVALSFDDAAAVPGDDMTAVTPRLAAYFDGDFSALRHISVAPAGTAFQRRVWRQLRNIRLGTTVSYLELAGRLGNPNAVRAVAAANAANPIALAIPCHRVVGKDGGLTGYAWGIERKRWLLTHEGALSQQSLW